MSCSESSNTYLGFLSEGYSGDVEHVTGLDPGVSLEIMDSNFPFQYEFLEVSFTPGETTAIIRTKKPFDADVIPESFDGSLAYNVLITCPTKKRETHRRIIKIIDLNDNSPVFEKKLYSTSISEIREVNTDVLLVRAVDRDITPAYRSVTYSYEPETEDFSLSDSGVFTLMRRLNYDVVPKYNFIVTARDMDGNNDTTSVEITVEDADNLNLYFSHSLYEAVIPENWEGVLSEIKPEPIKAQNGDIGNVNIIYSITSVSPRHYQTNLNISINTGVLTVVTSFDKEEMDSGVISVIIQATQTDDPLKIANAVVSVTVEDLNDNAPQFDQSDYNVSLLENSPVGTVVVRAIVTDLDQGGFVGTLKILPESTLFSMSHDGTLRVINSEALDREVIETCRFQIVAVDQPPDSQSATAQLTITVLDYNDNAPQFPSIPSPLQFPEGEYSEENPGEILTILPTDADSGLNGEATLSLSPPHPLFTFREDGMLLVVGPLDRESKETYDLVLLASDKGSPQRENMTIITVTVTDVNDNSPKFSSSIYDISIPLKDAEEGKLLMTLRATDPDTGINSLITYSFSTGHSPYLAIDSKTGEVTLTADVTEETTIHTTAVATDHGTPPLNTTARVVVNIRNVSMVEGVAFQSLSYNFSLPENQQIGVTVGQVHASSVINQYEISYNLKTHNDLFSINNDGTILTKGQLDKEQQEWYFLDVEAVDTRTPPTSAMAVVRIQVEDVNESPEFSSKDYEASVFSIAPYKTSVIQVKALDPDAGDSSRLVYSLSGGSSAFDVDPASGLVYVVSAAGLGGQNVTLEVKATDPQGLYATATINVMVQGSVSSSDVTTISLNQAANIVERKVPEVEKALGKALGWTIHIIHVWSSDGEETQILKASIRTLVSFTTLDGDKPVSSGKVQKKLQTESDEVNTELALVFGNDVQFHIVTELPNPSSNQDTVIALGVLFAVCLLALIVASVFAVRKSKDKGSDTDSMDNPADFKESNLRLTRRD